MLALALGGSACRAAPHTGPAERITIPRGATLRAVADTLHAHQAIDSPRLLTFYARVTGAERAIQAGTYEIARRSPERRVLEVLVSGRTALNVLTVPEGLMLTEVAAAVERQLGIPADRVHAAARDSVLRATLGVRHETLEGFLYPSTYFVPVDVDAEGVVRQMVAEFQRRWRPAWSRRADSLGMSRTEVVILASIIEGEVRHAPDRAFVSSVYHNRMRHGMRLQADPTVVYALGERRRLFERDYRTPSPYNTYLIDGLPPSPIGQPSEASIRAALYPATTDFLYLVARPDGQHVFSRTLREHRQTVRRLREPANRP